MLKQLRSSFVAAALAAVAAALFIAPTAARAQLSPGVGPVFAFTTTNVQLGGTAPATASTTLPLASSAALDSFSKCVIDARLAGVTGGTLDVYIQSSVAAGAAGSWYDVVHFPQLAAAAAAIGYAVTLTRGGTAAAPTVVNAVDGTPVLAANAAVVGGLGNALRVVFVTGTLVTAGSAQTVQALCSSL